MSLSSMKTVWYMAQGFPVSGGIEAHIVNYATELREHGCQVKVVVPDALPGAGRRKTELATPGAWDGRRKTGGRPPAIDRR